MLKQIVAQKLSPTLSPKESDKDGAPRRFCETVRTR
jgi:hypothetical protein